MIAFMAFFLDLNSERKHIALARVHGFGQVLQGLACGAIAEKHRHVIGVGGGVQSDKFAIDVESLNRLIVAERLLARVIPDCAEMDPMPVDSDP